jgi:hypothetical protein
LAGVPRLSEDQRFVNLIESQDHIDGLSIDKGTKGTG